MDVWVITRLSLACSMSMWTSLQFPERDGLHFCSWVLEVIQRWFSETEGQVTASSVTCSIWWVLLSLCISRIFNTPGRRIGNCFDSVWVSGHLTAWIFHGILTQGSFIDTTWVSFKDRAYVSHFRRVPAPLLTKLCQTFIAIALGLAFLEDTLFALILAYYLYSMRTERW